MAGFDNWLVKMKSNLYGWLSYVTQARCFLASSRNQISFPFSLIFLRKLHNFSHEFNLHST